MPNLSDIIYAYPDMNVVVHEHSLVERGLLTESLLEVVALADEDDFHSEISACEGIVLL
jgi:tRNA 2-thiouridine synthesizing protein C